LVEKKVDEKAVLKAALMDLQ
jgi:hypothetical protein